MKDLESLYKECLEELDKIGIKYGIITKIVPNSRLTRTWGRCKLVEKKANPDKNKFLIEISSRLLKDEVEDVSTKNTIIHEILHTCKNCYNHGATWQKQASVVNKNYPQYNIKRTTSHTEKGISDEDEYKYIIKCNLCNHQWKYRRKTKVVTKCETLTCPICHTKTLKCKSLCD